MLRVVAEVGREVRVNVHNIVIRDEGVAVVLSVGKIGGCCLHV